MMKALSIIFSFFLCTCSNNDIKHVNKTVALQSSSKIDSSLNKNLAADSITIWYKKSQQEFAEFNSKYQINWLTRKVKEPNKFPWKEGKKILVYYVAGEAEKQATWECRTSSGKEITQADYEDFCDIINNPDSYNNTTASCFNPSLAIVVYDEENVPMEYSEVCLDCNRINTSPHEIDFDFFHETDFYGLSSEARSALRAMFLEWGVPYESYSESWDNEFKR